MHNTLASANREDARAIISDDILVASVTVLVRLGALIAMPIIVFPDSQLYRIEAANIIAGQGINSHLIMPLLPLAFAILGGGVLAVRLVDLSASVLLSVSIRRIALIVSGDRRIALASGLCAALYPIGVAYATFGLTETLFTALLMAGILALFQRRYWTGSVAFVLAILTRPTIEPLAPILVLLVALVVHRETAAPALRRVATYGLVYLCLMSPWWLYNANRYGAFVRLNLGGGQVLYTGNNPMNQSGGGISLVDVNLKPFEGMEPLERDRALRQEALSYIKSHPLRFIQLAVIKIGRFWRPWPYAQLYRGQLTAGLASLSVLPLAFLALAGFWKGRRLWRRLLPFAVTTAYFTLVHAVTIGSIRYRFPVEFILMVPAGLSLWIWRRTSRD